MYLYTVIKNSFWKSITVVADCDNSMQYVPLWFLWHSDCTRFAMDPTVGAYNAPQAPIQLGRGLLPIPYSLDTFGVLLWTPSALNLSGFGTEVSPTFEPWLHPCYYVLKHQQIFYNFNEGNMQSFSILLSSEFFLSNSFLNTIIRFEMLHCVFIHFSCTVCASNPNKECSQLHSTTQIKKSMCCNLQVTTSTLLTSYELHIFCKNLPS